jgi:hypothetical protein
MRDVAGFDGNPYALGGNDHRTALEMAMALSLHL